MYNFADFISKIIVKLTDIPGGFLPFDWIIGTNYDKMQMNNIHCL